MVMKEKVLFDFIKYCLISNQIECNETDKKTGPPPKKIRRKQRAYELTFLTIKEGHSMSTFLNI